MVRQVGPPDNLTRIHLMYSSGRSWSTTRIGLLCLTYHNLNENNDSKHIFYDARRITINATETALLPTHTSSSYMQQRCGARLQTAPVWKTEVGKNETQIKIYSAATPLQVWKDNKSGMTLSYHGPTACNVLADVELLASWRLKTVTTLTYSLNAHRSPKRCKTNFPMTFESGMPLNYPNNA